MVALGFGQTSASMQPHSLMLLRRTLPRRRQCLMANHLRHLGNTARAPSEDGSTWTASSDPRSSPTQRKNRTIGRLKHSSGSPFPATNSARFAGRRSPLTSGKPDVHRNAEIRGREFSAKVEFRHCMTQEGRTTHDGGAADTTNSSLNELPCRNAAAG
jgi:hypothetical protein